MQENQCLSEIMDSSHSPSHVSEPPDIRNWFSSYAYESFVFDTNDDVEDTVSQESERDKERFVVGERQMEHVVNKAAYREIGSCLELDAGHEICADCFVKSNSSMGDNEPDDGSLNSSRKILDSPESSPIFTEPPDVKNWFSSYAYDSPALDTSDRFEDSLRLEREPDNFVVEDSDGEKEEKLVIIRKVRSRDKKHDEQQNSVAGNGGNGSPSFQKNLCSVEIFKESLEGRTLLSNDTSSSKDVKESSFNSEVSNSKPKQKFPQEARSATLNINRSSSSDREKKSPMKLFRRTELIPESMEDVNLIVPTGNAKIAPVSGASPRKQTHGRNDKENEPKGITENGFVAARKNRSTRTENENSLKMPQEILVECPRNKRTVPPAGEKNAVVRRKALTETTNYHNFDALEITGKWRCPQRNKPNRGPPLKQLRLEQWIHRV